MSLPPIESTAPITPMQRSFLFELADRGHDGTNVEQIVCLLGRPLELAAFRDAVELVHRRHPALRTVFPDFPAGSQQAVLAEAAPDLEVRRADGSIDAAIDRFLAEDRKRRFDPAERPPVRWTVFEGDEAAFVLTFHHALLDGRSFPILLEDLARAEDSLRGEAPLPSPPPGPMALYHWHHHRTPRSSDGYWRALLDGVNGKPAFPTHLAPLETAEGRGHLRRRLDRETSDRLKEGALRQEVTLNTLVQAGWALVFGKHAMTDDVVFGAARAGRHNGAEGAKETVGVGLNIVPIRARIAGAQTVRALLRGLRAQTIEMRPHEATPLAEVMRAAELDPTGLPFDSAIVFDTASLNGQMQALRPGRPERYTLHEQMSFPLGLYAYGEEEVGLELGFGRARVTDAAAETLLEQLTEVLRQLAERPDAQLAELGLASAEEQVFLRERLDGPCVALPANTALDLVRSGLARFRDRIAVRFHCDALTYGELEEASAAVARALVAAGCKAGDRIGVYRQRDVFLPAVLLGIWRAGAAYVPLDPSYPAHRIAYKLQDAGLSLVLAQPETTPLLPPNSLPVLAFSDPRTQDPGDVAIDPPVRGEDLAYVLYTSGSTGQPKGTLVEQRQLANFFVGMDPVVSPEPGAVWLAVTSLSFDISVLELLYPLAHGLTIVVHDERDDRTAPRRPKPKIELGVMFFSGADDDDAAARYDFLLEAARRADEAGLGAVWTPERHFHEFGGPYPNPAVLGAALARSTRNLQIRAGSVVLPLHHPARIAEEWAVVDNLSRGRVGISFASGWHARDFVLRPETFADRKRVLSEGIELVRRLWRGESISFPGPGSEFTVRTLPRPVQPELPVWVTAAGNPATYEEAGRLGANVLTHLLGQTFAEVEEKIRRYRAARAEAGHPGRGVVTLMLHTFLGEDRDAVKDLVREPMKAYLRTAFGLVRDNAFDFPAVQKQVSSGADLDAAISALSEAELDALHEHAFERYFETSGLFGTMDDARRIVERAEAIGADEVACLIDFGVPFSDALDSLDRVGALQAEWLLPPEDFSLPALVERFGVTHLQCTPSRAKLLTLDDSTRAALGRIRHLFVGGEMLSADLARELTGLVAEDVTNMYGPTETTVWSSIHRVTGQERSVPVGRPIANTTLRVLDEKGGLAPIGVAGELGIGGLGVTRGYHGRPELTDERFVPDPVQPESRMYRTGDLARWRPDGRLEFLGRRDHQVKIRGYRIELEEIEAALRTVDGIFEAVVTAWASDDGVPRLVAYTVGAALPEAALRARLREELPAFMIPNHFVRLVALPLLPNGKLDRGALPDPSSARAPLASKAEVETGPGPEGQLARAAGDADIEAEIAAVWKEVLGLEAIGREQNFFDLGGHSLLVVQVHGKLKAHHPGLGITELFRFPTVASLAGHLGAAAMGPESTADLKQNRADARRAALAKRRMARRRG